MPRRPCMGSSTGRWRWTTSRDTLHPHVAGGLADEVLGATHSMGQRAIGRYMNLLGPRPSNYYNRNPLYRNTYVREVERLLNLGGPQRHTGGVTRQARRAEIIEGELGGFSPEDIQNIQQGLTEGPTAGISHRSFVTRITTRWRRPSGSCSRWRIVHSSPICITCSFRSWGRSRSSSRFGRSSPGRTPASSAGP